ncbi:MAG TPA: hypothetical protein VGN16_13565 [Acidobacteriaceae bacterium]|jgi:hypothetical protein
MKSTISGLTAAALLLPASAVLAQMTGVSHPESLNDPVVTTQPPQQHYAKPSPAIPMQTGPQAATPTLRTHDYNLPATEVTAAAPATVTVTNPGYSTLGSVAPGYGSSPAYTGTPAGNGRHEDTFVVTNDVNSGVVTEVAWRENEVPEGTIMHARLAEEISTEMTTAGTPFQARLTRAVEHNGRVILPIGTVISGRVTELHGGHRIGGAAYIHIQPDTITLPDGSTRHVAAQVVDLKHSSGIHVNDEGTIVGNDHAKGTLAAIGLATGGAAAAGAVIGGGVGAAVGAGIGAGVGTAVWLKHEAHQTLPQGTDVVFSLNRPLLLQTASLQ